MPTATQATTSICACFNLNLSLLYRIASLNFARRYSQVEKIASSVRLSFSDFSERIMIKRVNSFFFPPSINEIRTFFQRLYALEFLKRGKFCPSKGFELWSTLDSKGWGKRRERAAVRDLKASHR